MQILMTGGTGLLGSRVSLALRDKGHSVFVLTRHPTMKQSLEASQLEFVGWTELSPLCKRVKFDAVIHLAGEPLFPGRWTKAKKIALRESRIGALKKLLATLKQAGASPATLISASAVGYYGSCGDDILTEEHAAGSDFLAELCQDWEKTARLESRQMFPHIRAVSLRFGVILDAHGGALQRMLSIFRVGLGAPLGSGKQWMSWVHVEDASRAIVIALENQRCTAAYNVVAPTPVTNGQFTAALAKILHAHTLPAVPGFALKTVLGEGATALLDSQRVSSKKIESLGFTFRFPDLDSALRDLC